MRGLGWAQLALASTQLIPSQAQRPRLASPALDSPFLELSPGGLVEHMGGKDLGFAGSWQISCLDGSILHSTPDWPASCRP